MTDDRELDRTLRTHFNRVRQQDAERAPAFAAMIASARLQSPIEASSSDVLSIAQETAPTATIRKRWRPAVVLAWSAPMLAAAALTIMFLRAPRTADEEFDQLVNQWSQTTEAMHSPTDQLLELPGAEYLRSTPMVGAPRPRNPS